MVIVNVEQCLSQLNNEVEQKIIQRQNEVVQNEGKTSLRERLNDGEFRKKLLANLGETEKKHLKTLIQKYNSYVKNSSVEEQIVSIEEKLALLLLRQIGVIYKIDEKKHKQQFIIPIEFVESFFELTFPKENKVNFSRSFSLKYYLYYLLELTFFIKEKANPMLDLELLNKRISDVVSWELLLKFLINEGLVIHSKNKLTVVDQRCKHFFGKPNKEIKRKLSSFVLWESLHNPFAVNFIMWALFSNEDGMKRKVLLEYLKNRGQFSETTFNKAFEQLCFLGICATSNEDILYLTKEEVSSEMVQGTEAGILEFLIHVAISNDALWTFRSWGTFLQWDVMIHIAITKETVGRALREERNVSDLTNYLKTYLSESVMSSWQETFSQWLEEGKPIKKKDRLIFYSLSENLHLKFIEEHWGAWWEKTYNGIVIEHELADEFEKLLRKLSLNIISAKKELQHDEPLFFQFDIINEFPNINSAIPEVENIPKQWFILTGYNERTTQRIVKQAIILQLRLQIENQKKEILYVRPLQMVNVNGRYEILTEEKVKIMMTEISKIAVIHPLKS